MQQEHQLILWQYQQSIIKNAITTCYNYNFPSAKVLASLSSKYVPRKPSTVTTDYIISRVEIYGGDFDNSIYDVHPYKILATKFAEQDLSCQTYFMVTGKSFILNWCEFHNLIICYIYLLTHSSSFCVQVQVSCL